MPPEARGTLERELGELGIRAGAVAHEVIGHDSREHWADTLAIPYCWICSIELYVTHPKWGQHAAPRWLQSGRATGVLIAPACVLTVAHALTLKMDGRVKAVERIVVAFGRNGRRKPLGSVEATSWLAARRWDAATERPRASDFAILRLKRAVGNQTFKVLDGRQLGWWASHDVSGGTSITPVVTPERITGRVVTSAGYPADRCGIRRIGKKAIDKCARDEPDLWASTQWRAAGRVPSVHPDGTLLYHTIDTYEGQSGSPVWCHWRDRKSGQLRRRLVGIHVAPGTYRIDTAGGPQRLIENVAVRIRKEVLEEIAWLERELVAPERRRLAREGSEAETGQFVGRQDLGVSSKQAAAYDWAFRGSDGERLREVTAWAAGEVDLNPGLLADTLIAETRRSSYLTRREVSSFEIGTDDFYIKRQDIERKVPAYANVRWDPRRVVDNVNETGRTVKSVRFASGRDATLASAAYLKHGEVVLREAAQAAHGDFNALSVETRYALVRLAFNAGHGRAKTNLTEALSGKDILIRKPPKKAGPQRRATIHVARAMRLSGHVFGVTPR